MTRAPGLAGTSFSVFNPFGQRVSSGTPDLYGRTTVRFVRRPKDFKDTNAYLPSWLQETRGEPVRPTGPNPREHPSRQARNGVSPRVEKNIACKPSVLRLCGRSATTQFPSGETEIRLLIASG